MFLILLMLSNCRMNMKDLNDLRMKAEELESMFLFFAPEPADQETGHHYNRSSKLLFEVVDKLFDCTLYADESNQPKKRRRSRRSASTPPLPPPEA